MFKKFKYYDWLVIVSVLCLWGAHASTNFLIAQHVSVAENVQQATAIVEVMEAHPLARWAILTLQFKLVFSTIVVPTFILGTYVLLRRSLEKRYQYGAEHVAWIFFFAAFTNFLNDASQVLAILAG